MGIAGRDSTDARLAWAHVVAFGVLLATCPATPGQCLAAGLAGALALVSRSPVAAWILAAGAAATFAWGPTDLHHAAAPRLAGLGLVLLGGLAGRDPRASLRLGAAGAALAIGALVAFKQLAIATPALPSAALLALPLFGAAFACAASLVGAPADPRVGFALIAAAIARLALPVAAPAPHPDTDLGRLALVADHPTDREPGEDLARRLGPELPLRAGWDPRDPIDPAIATSVAWTLDGWGRRERAIAFLRRQDATGPSAFALSVLAREAGQDDVAAQVWRRATVPGDVLIDPDVVFHADEWPVGGDRIVLFALTKPVDGLDVTARGTSWNGPPKLIATVGGSRSGPTEVPEAGARTHLEGLPIGAYRLILQFPNDASGPDGDRNLYDVTVTVDR